MSFDKDRLPGRSCAMISKEAVLECIKAPMEQFHRDMVRHFGNWNAQVEAAEILLSPFILPVTADGIAT